MDYHDRDPDSGIFAPRTLAEVGRDWTRSPLTERSFWARNKVRVLLAAGFAALLGVGAAATSADKKVAPVAVPTPKLPPASPTTVAPSKVFPSSSPQSPDGGSIDG